MIISSFSYVIFTIMTVFVFVAVYRILSGPTMPDRMLALDLLGANVIGLIIIYSIMNNQSIFIDVVILLSMLGFFGSVAFAYYLEKKGR